MKFIYNCKYTLKQIYITDLPNGNSIKNGLTGILFMTLPVMQSLNATHFHINTLIFGPSS